MINKSIADKLPRLDLREEAFRKYESYISRAISGSYTLNPQLDLAKPMNPHTFCTRFRDAILGYRRYHYPSEIIPKNYDVNLIKAFELADGNVLIENESADKATANLHAARDQEKILDIVRRKDLFPPDPEVYGREIFVDYDTPEQRNWLIDNSHGGGVDYPEKKQVGLM